MENKVTINLDGNIYHADAVQKALYIFSDKISGHVKVDKSNENQLLIEISRLESCTDDLQELKKSLINEINDQSLRLKISDETKDVRNLILAHAFSKTPLIKNDD